MHELFAQTRALIQGVHGHIPDRGIDDAITGATGKAHELGQARIMTPETHQQQTVLQGAAHPPQGPAAPAHRVAELLQFDQVDLTVTAEHQSDLA